MALYYPRRFLQIEIDDHIKKKMKKMSIDGVFSEYLSVLSERKSGHKIITQKIFLMLMERVKTPEDIKQMKNILADYLGHENKIN